MTWVHWAVVAYLCGFVLQVLSVHDQVRAAQNDPESEDAKIFESIVQRHNQMGNGPVRVAFWIAWVLSAVAWPLMVARRVWRKVSR